MRKAALVSGVALLALCGVGGFLLRPKGAGPAKRDTATVTTADLSSVVVESGTVEPARTVEVKGRVSGRVAKLLAEVGDQVKKGQLLAVIDPQETRLQVDQNRAQLAGAQAQVQRGTLEIEQRERTAEAAIDTARARVAQLRVELKAQPELYAAAVTSARAALRSAQQERTRLAQSAQPNERAATLAALEEAKENALQRRAEYQRQSELEAAGYVATRELQSAKNAIAVAEARQRSAQVTSDRLAAQQAAERAKAEANVRSAQADLERAETNASLIATKRQELRSAEASLRQARAGRLDPLIASKTRDQSRATVDQLQSVVSDAERNLGETRILAPMDGIVTQRSVQVGELATGLSQFSQGSTVMRIEDRSKFRVRLNINEIDVAKLKVGLKADVRVEALPGRELAGIVTKIAPASQAINATPTAAAPGNAAVPKYEVEITLEDAAGGLRSGMTAKCTIRVEDRRGAPSLPIEYVLRSPKGDAVLVADGAKATKRVAVTLGVVTATRAEILSGLKTGDEVVKPPFDGPERKGFQFGGDGG